MAEAAIILAAGQGKRMNSDLPKVALRAAGRPLVDYVLDAAEAAGAKRLVVVVGYRQEVVRELLSGRGNVEFAEQREQLGTGHAVIQCRDVLEDSEGSVFVLNGDMPLVRAASLQALSRSQQAAAAACVVGTAVTEQNEGLGRIVRDGQGEFLQIVEQRDATPKQRAIEEINTGCFIFQGADLLRALDEIRPENDQAEYYLTDAAAILRDQGRPVRAEPCFRAEEALGVNTPEQLAAVEAHLARRSSR